VCLKKNINILRNSLITAFIVIFIVLYFIFITTIYTIPNDFQGQNSLFMYFGFIVVIIGFFLFFFIKLKDSNKSFLKVKFLSENFIKIILLILMSLCLFIRPITFSTTIIAWKEVNLFNLFRSIVYLFGLGFLPGAFLFNLIFPDITLFKRFKVEPFVIKIAFYPLLSFLMLGVCVLIIDNIGFVNPEFYMFFIFIFILNLGILDFIIQFYRNKENHKQDLFSKRITSINISRSTFIILIISIGVILISLGILDTLQYLISGDSWTGIKPAIYIAKPYIKPIDYGKEFRYPIFWGYISYGFSVLSGIPLVNINALLAVFCYLHIIISYLFMKAILYNFKPKYIIFSTILLSIFSGLFFISPFKEEQAIISSIFFNIGALNYFGQLSFIYKSFSLYLLYFALALFIIATRTNKENSTRYNKSSENYKFIIISALFLIISYMIYMLPLIIGLIFIFIYILFMDNKRQNLKFFYIFLISLFLIFFTFDFMTERLNNYLFSDKFSDFLIWLLIIRVDNNREKLVIPDLAYMFFISIILFISVILCLDIFYRKFFAKRMSSSIICKQQPVQILKNKSRKLLVKTFIIKTFFVLYLSLFTISLFIQFFNLFFKSFIYKFIYVEENYWYYFISLYLDQIFLNFGVIGILGIFLSYFCYKKNRRLFYILIAWLFLTLIYSSINFFNGFLFNKLILTSPQEIEYEQLKYMLFWYSRNWFFIVPVLCIFCAIGILELMKLVHDKIFIFNSHKYMKIFLKSFLISNIIIFGYTSVITSAIYWGRDEGDATVRDCQAQVIGWISNNLPKGHTILIEKDHNIINGIESMTFIDYYHTREIIWAYKDYQFNLEWIKRKNITYAVLYNGTHPEVHPTVSDFLDNFLTKEYLSEVVYQYGNLIVYTNSSLI